MNNIAVLLSGGVDSSVALVRLIKQGYKVTAFYLKIWLEDELSFLGECPWEDDLANARAVCEQYDVPLEVIPLQRAYWDRVVAHTIAQIKAGRTPNPDILCNQQVKFDAFYDAICDRFDVIATGHYAQVHYNNGAYRLYQAPDAVKDQTYFLSYLSQEQLSRAWFPIGDLSKADVRQRAHDFDLPNKARKDSQGICFLGKLKFPDFVRYHLGDRIGKFVEYETETVQGEHNGFWYYTIGQRQGIGLGGGPWYVVSKDVDANIVYISRTYYAPDKVRCSFEVAEPHWIAGKPDISETIHVKLRHGKQMHTCDVNWVADNRYQVVLHDRDQGIAPGQYAVFYKNSECIGSGVIAQ